MSSRIGELGQRGYRRTTQRASVLDILEGARGHMSAEEIARVVDERGLGLNRSTVYRTLELLVDIGMVKATRMGRALYYEISHDGEAHHHISCVRCGGTVHVSAAQVDRVLARLAADQGVEVLDVQVLVRGVCRSCRKASA